MRKLFIALFVLFIHSSVFSQKKNLDHSVYDAWQSIGEKLISNNGKFVVYTINPQEGDGVLIIQQTNGKKILSVDRGYNARIANNDKLVICKIKPLYQQTRTAKMLKKKPDEMPKDSLAVIDINALEVEKTARVKNYNIPEKNDSLLVYLSEKTLSDTRPKQEPDSLTRINAIAMMADSLVRVADSLKNKLVEVQAKGMNALQPKKDNKALNKTNEDQVEEGTELTIVHLNDRKKAVFKLVTDYAVSKTGNSIALKTSRKNSDSLVKASVIRFNSITHTADTLLKGFNDVKSLTWDEAGKQLAFVAERDSAVKALQKFYKLYYYHAGDDSAKMIVARNTKGMLNNWTVAEFSNVLFSTSGKRLFFGTAPILPPKDTTLPEFERVNVDIWNYKDDDLMSAQLFNLDKDLKKNYVARFDLGTHEVVQITNEKLNKIVLTNEGDGQVFYAASDYGKRIERQWQGFTLNDIFVVNPVDGTATSVVTNFKGSTAVSYTGKYLLLYNEKLKKYFCYNAVTRKLVQVAKDIPHALYEEDFDMPDDPSNYGVVKWMENDKAVFIYDRFDMWQVDPEGRVASVCITNGRKNKNQFRYITVDADEKYISPDQSLVFKIYNETDKTTCLGVYDLTTRIFSVPVKTEKVNTASIIKAKNDLSFALTKENFGRSPDIYSFHNQISVQLSHINPQQGNYNWGTAELFKWKAFNGKPTEGIVYKPENFDAKKKYPMIVYFYERNNNTLYNYLPPSPTPSRLNISFFVSRGYIVFVPDIWYTTGHPGKDAYNAIVSGTKALLKTGYVDSTRLGLQGQSWGGYQTAYIITQTNLYAAAWAGAPVVNMFSAYGGIRWESGVNRQFQYEHSQSRIGATPWERSDLYIENSPLFHLPKVKTPLVIMSNDADGAVPWYQGIEFFTDMRRLNKPVWLLNYNGEAHNLMERKNRKDIQVREQQFFDWLLKGEKPAKWITEGVPAVLKGRDWGLQVE